jgi:hypothetical protein
VATQLVEHVYFDIAGFPAVLRSDRGKSFTAAIVQQVNQLLGVTHSFASAYRPQSTGYIEASHKRPSQIISAYCAMHPATWFYHLKLAQWAMRSTPRADKQGMTPVEIITGLKPQGVLSKLWERLGTKSLDPASYVSALKDNLKNIYDVIKTAQDAALETAKHSGLKSSSEVISVGDYVFIERPPLLFRQGEQEGASRRLLPKADPTLYRVVKVFDSTVVVCDPTTGSTELGFAQPVHISRLRPFELCELESPVDMVPPKIRIRSRDGQWKHGVVETQSSTGTVRIKFSDNSERVIDLSAEEYQWLT